MEEVGPQESANFTYAFVMLPDPIQDWNWYKINFNFVLR